VRPKHIVIVGYQGIAALDLIGPLEAFSTACREGSAEDRCYRVTVAALGAKSFRSESGLRFTAGRFLSLVSEIDTLIIPGGGGLREPAANAKLAAWIRFRAPSIRRIASVCTGIYGLARSGLLKGRTVTTHWRFCADVAARYPELNVDSNVLYLRDGKFYTSAGVTAGIDLSLALIEEDFGPQVALAVARELVVFVRRSGGQEQYSEPLRFQAQASSRFADLVPWALGHLDRDLSVDALAKRAYLSPRQFSRRFQLEFKCTPGAFVQKLRLDEARERLCTFEGSVETVGRSVGFDDPDSFRRAFERRFGVAPSEYRRRFSPQKLLARPVA
jgi:transcriptional regulator GlxA family with amidase domain